MGNNYTIKEWNLKFNKKTNKLSIIKYYNLYKYISIIVLFYLYMNLNYIENNENENINNIKNMEYNAYFEFFKINFNFKYVINYFTEQINYYFF